MIKNPVAWPDGARVAVSFTWDLDADSLLHIMHPLHPQLLWTSALVLVSDCGYRWVVGTLHHFLNLSPPDPSCSSSSELQY